MIEKLQILQETLDLTDRQFARRIGISGAMWNNVKHSKRSLGMQSIVGIVAAFPELKEDLWNYLTALASQSKEI